MSQTMANLVDVRGVSFSRANRLIFDDISLTVPRGKITAIMGPSGIGKTTLLRLIGGHCYLFDCAGHCAPAWRSFWLGRGHCWRAA